MVLGAPKKAADKAISITGGVGDKMGGRKVNQMLPNIGSVAGYPIASLAIGIAALTILAGLLGVM